MRALNAVLLISLSLQCVAEEASSWLPARLVSIDYPLLALQSLTEGVVKIECTVAEDGSVSAAKIISGSPLLGGAVLTRIGEWRFRKTGPVGSSRPGGTAVLKFNFVLENVAVLRPNTKFIFDYPNSATIVSQQLRRDH